MVDLICKILHIGKTTYYKYLKEEYPIIKFLNSFSKEELTELLETGQIKSLIDLRYIFKVKLSLTKKIQSLNEVEMNILKKMINDYKTEQQKILFNVDEKNFYADDVNYYHLKSWIAKKGYNDYILSDLDPEVAFSVFTFIMNLSTIEESLLEQYNELIFNNPEAIIHNNKFPTFIRKHS